MEDLLETKYKIYRPLADLEFHKIFYNNESGLGQGMQYRVGQKVTNNKGPRIEITRIIRNESHALIFGFALYLIYAKYEGESDDCEFLFKTKNDVPAANIETTPIRPEP